MKNSLIKSSVMLIVLTGFILSTEGCAQRKCSANGGGYIDKPPVVRIKRKTGY